MFQPNEIACINELTLQSFSNSNRVDLSVLALTLKSIQMENDLKAGKTIVFKNIERNPDDSRILELIKRSKER